jgi:endoglucanase
VNLAVLALTSLLAGKEAPAVALRAAVESAAPPARAAEAEPARPACDHKVAPWPHHAKYVETFITSDGRVKEPSAGDRTTSEGQAYGMFFALVANDRPLFDRLLAWTRANLAGGDLAKNLPSWTWGKDPKSGAWKVLDPSPASDADVWMAYLLLESEVLWKDKAHGDLGRAILKNVIKREVVDLPRVGPMLLPGPVGFELQKGKQWRLNPSYLPVQMLRRLGALAPGPWADMAATSVRLLRETAPRGFAADWVVYDQELGFGVDPVSGPIGSYDAIRVYLWAGMLAADDPLRNALAVSISGPYDLFKEDGVVREKVDVRTGADIGRSAPPGFYAVLLPEARHRKDEATYKALDEAINKTANDGLFGNPPAYYDQNLILFARGFTEGRYRFDANGALRPAWSGECTCDD